MSDGSEVLRVDDLRMYFDLGVSRLDRFLGGEKERKFVRAVDGVSLTISREETLGLVGESGSGKSTVARCILGLIPATSGRILFEGMDVAKVKGRQRRLLRSKMQVVFQDPAGSLDPSMRVRDIIAEPLEATSGPPRRQVDEAVERMMELVGLAQEYSNRFPHEFSGGQRQRIGIARALITSPEFVVLDEPTSALDASIQAQVLNLLKDLKRNLSLTSLFITHNMKVVSFMSDRIAVMYLGKIAEIGTRDEVISEPLHPYTRMLIASIPKTDPDNRFTESEEGRRIMEQGKEAPSPINPPSGCVFHTRCPYAMERCKVSEPGMTNVSPTRSVACYLYGDSEIPNRAT